jgi:orotate phosphoribosyltransferase
MLPDFKIRPANANPLHRIMGSSNHDQILLDELYRRAFFRSDERPSYSQSGVRAGWALDLREPLSEGQLLTRVADAVTRTICSHSKIQQVAGYGMGASFIVGGVIANNSDWIGGLVRERSKPYGFRRLVEGSLRRDRPLVLLDDVLSTGRSLARATDLLRRNGYNPVAAVPIFWFSWETGYQLLIDRGLAVWPLAELLHAGNCEPKRTHSNHDQEALLRLSHEKTVSSREAQFRSAEKRILERRDEKQSRGGLDAEVDRICDIAKNHLLQIFKSSESNETRRSDVHEASGTVCVTLRLSGVIRGCYSITSPRGFIDAARRAVRMAAMDSRFGGEICRDEAYRTGVEMWILQSRRPIKCIGMQHCCGLLGVEARSSNRTAFFLPFAHAESGFAGPEELAERLLLKAGITADEDFELFETEWQRRSLFGTSNTRNIAASAEVYSVEFVFPSLESSAAAAAHFLSGTQTLTGEFAHFENAAMAKRNTNAKALSVRTLICIDQLLRYSKVASALGRDDLSSQCTDSGRIGLQFILGHLREWHRLTYFFDGPNRASTGANAYCAAVLNQFDPKLARSVAESILRSQSPDGWFPENQVRPTREGCPDFAPAQALLVLERILGADIVNLDYKTALDRAFNTYSRRVIPKTTPYFCCWQAKAWSRIALRTHSEQHACFAFALLDRLLTFQLRGRAVHKEFVGGYEVGQVPGARIGLPSFIAALFSDALFVGCELASGFGRAAHAKKYLEGAQAGLAFVRRLQISAEQASFLPAARGLIEGGFRRGPDSFEMRCDFSGHGLACILTALEVCFPGSIDNRGRANTVCI